MARGPVAPPSGTVGVIANPMSGRDVRRLAARARRDSPEEKQNQIARAVVGAAAAGAQRFLLVPDCFRISRGAVESLNVGARFDFLDVGPLETKPSDTLRTAAAMRAAGADALLVLGGDGTSRIVATAWPDAPMVPMSTGTNNVFPVMQEATVAGLAAGLVATGAVPLALAATQAKVVRAVFDDGATDVAVVDAVVLADDDVGNLLPFEPGRLRALVLARAEPNAVGMSPIGGLLEPCGIADDFGVEVRCAAEGTPGTRPLLAAVSPGLFRRAHVTAARRLALGEVAVVEGPGVVAFDGDRTRALAPGERCELRVERSGPFVIDAARALRVAGAKGVFEDRHFHDGLERATGLACC
ncbi:MAG: NAD(+)/NADH kinase [Myxococcota bacterium]